MPAPKRPFWRRHPWWTWLGGGALVLLAALVVAANVALHHAEPYVRARIVSALEQRFHGHVELDSFHMSLIDGLRAEGKGLRIWAPAQPGSPASSSPTGMPLIQLAEFRFHAPLRYDPSKPFYIAVVQLTGLNIILPPKHRFPHAEAKTQKSSSLHFDVGALECTDVHLTMLTSKPGKTPLEFVIARLRLTNVGNGGAMSFNAQLTNPKPVGIIYSQGDFGPWVVDDPGESPVAGTYRFEHANLASFKGIAGMLSSTGRYSGNLRNITVDGETQTPDFRLGMGGNALNLHTQFHALVDGTDGDTWLQPVDATLGGSHLIAQGKIVRVTAAGAQNGQPAHPAGRLISLTVNVDRGRMGDFLLLATHDPTPLLTGVLTMKTTLDIPPGPASVRNRMILNGSFSLDNALFTSPKIQSRIRELSHRGQGEQKDSSSPGATPVRSTMQGSFKMADGVVTLPDLQYIVPGAEIDLKGTYGVAGGALNFSGKAKMQATVSQMVGGWKGFLLKPVDKLFEHNGAGTDVSISVQGTRTDPQFAVDFGGLKKTLPQKPGGP